MEENKEVKLISSGTICDDSYPSGLSERLIHARWELIKTSIS